MRFSGGSWLGRYQLVSLLGAGGMGEVYLARDPKIIRAVPIKVLPAESSKHSFNLRSLASKVGITLGNSQYRER